MTFGRRTLAELGGGAWMLEPITRGYLALAEWLRGRLAEAERVVLGYCSGADGQRGHNGRLGLPSPGPGQRAQGRLDVARGTAVPQWPPGTVVPRGRAAEDSTRMRTFG